MVTTRNELKLKILTRMEREKKKRKRKGLHYSVQYINLHHIYGSYTLMPPRIIKE